MTVLGLNSSNDGNSLSTEVEKFLFSVGTVHWSMDITCFYFIIITLLCMPLVCLSYSTSVQQDYVFYVPHLSQSDSIHLGVVIQGESTQGLSSGLFQS